MPIISRSMSVFPSTGHHLLLNDWCIYFVSKSQVFDLKVHLIDLRDSFYFAEWFCELSSVVPHRQLGKHANLGTVLMLDLTGSMKMIQDDEVGFKEKPWHISYKITSKWDPKFLSSFGNCRPEKDLVRHSLVEPGKRLNPYPGHRLPQDCWLYGDPSPRSRVSFPLLCQYREVHTVYIMDHPPYLYFYDMQGDVIAPGILLHTVTPLIFASH